MKRLICRLIGPLLLFCASFCALLLVSIKGGYDIQTGTILDQLSCHELFRPLLVCCIAFAGCCAVIRPAQMRRFLGRFTWKSWIFMAGILFVIWHTIPAPDNLHGDAREYILQAQAIVLEQSIRIDPVALQDYWNRTNPYGKILNEVPPPQKELNYHTQAGGGFGGLYPDKYEHYRYYHYWMYSLIVAPLYALFHLLIPGGSFEYQAFRVMNILFLCLPFVLLWQRARTLPVLILSAFVMVTPLIGYTEWQHPELFCFCMIILAFWAVDLKRHSWQAPLWMGIAATQNIPIIFFFVPLIVLHLKTHGFLNNKKRFHLVTVYLAGGLLAISPMVYNLYYFGVVNVITSVGLADFSYASWSRVGHLFFSPMVGALWAFPVCFFAIPSAVRRKNRLFILVSILSIVAAAWLCTTTRNFNSSQIWSLRYTVWLLAPLWFIVLNGDGQLSVIRISMRSAIFMGEVLLILGVVQLFWSWPLGEKDLRGYLGCERSGIGVNAIYRLLHYPEEVEVLTENIQAREIKHPNQFKGIYLWEINEGQYVGIVSGHIGDERTTWLNERSATRRITCSYSGNPVLGPFTRIRIHGDLPVMPHGYPITIRTNTLNRRQKLR